MDQRIRKQTVQALELLIERYPNLRIGQILSDALGDTIPSLYFVTDLELARGLNQLFVSFTQFESAGIMKRD